MASLLGEQCLIRNPDALSIVNPTSAVCSTVCAAAARPSRLRRRAMASAFSKEVKRSYCGRRIQMAGTTEAACSSKRIVCGSPLFFGRKCLLEGYAYAYALACDSHKRKNVNRSRADLAISAELGGLRISSHSPQTAVYRAQVKSAVCHDSNGWLPSSPSYEDARYEL